MDPKAIDYSLYLVTDRPLSRGRPLPEIVAAAVRGGVTCVQLREKACTTREFIAQAREIRALLQEHHVPLIINDRVDVALAVEAEGVHLGQQDMDLATARRLAGDRMIIGISAESLADAVAAELGGADYIGVSPIHATPTKTDTAPALGLAGLRAIRQAVDLPIVGIGGLNADTCAGAIQSGADGVAVVSAVSSADDPEAAARKLLEIIRGARDS